MKIIFLLREKEFNLLQKDKSKISKKIKLNYFFTEKNNLTNVKKEKNAEKNFLKVDDGENVFINIYIEKEKKNILLDEKNILFISTQLKKEFSKEKKIVIVYHPPGSKNNEEYEDELNILNEKDEIKNNNIKLSFFSMTNDNIRTLGDLINVVNNRITGEDKTITKLYELNINLLSFWAALKYKYGISDNAQDEDFDKTIEQQIIDKIENINSEIKTYQIEKAEKQDFDFLKDMIRLLNKEINNQIGGNKEIYLEKY